MAPERQDRPSAVLQLRRMTKRYGEVVACDAVDLDL